MLARTSLSLEMKPLYAIGRHLLIVLFLIFDTFSTYHTLQEKRFIKKEIYHADATKAHGAIHVPTAIQSSASAAAASTSTTSGASKHRHVRFLRHNSAERCALGR